MPRSTQKDSVRVRRATATAAAVCAGLLVLSGCTDTAPAPVESATGSAPPTPTETPTPDAVVFLPDGTASDNLPIFRQVVEAVWAGEHNDAGRAYIDALTAAGFDRAAMEVTEDLSTVGHRAESLQFSVLWGSECLIGQVGPATGDPVATVVDALAEGGCLIGRTRPIDW
ncbi:hypothetical protein ACFC3F_05805 [Microbacterium sp. NPDC055910]|uniref:DUF6993 domain-containing protein n=1 Tax=Microbacterium sp. NPDC055910 TaxID=3345659 RepID=UPI0035E2C8B6